MVRQLIAARIPVELVLAPVCLTRLREDLSGDLLVAAVRVDRRVRRDLRAVDRDDANLDEPRPRAHPEDAGEQVGKRRLVATTEVRDRRVIGHQVGREDSVGDVLDTGPLDLARRPVPARVRVEKQRDHHRRLVGRPTMPISPIGGVEARKIELLDRLEDAPHQVILGHPVGHRRRHQEHLLTINRNEVLTHTQNPPERIGRHPPFSRQAPRKQERRLRAAVLEEEKSRPRKFVWRAAALPTLAPWRQIRYRRPSSRAGLLRGEAVVRLSASSILAQRIR
jgi:hypothetical protein